MNTRNRFQTGGEEKKEYDPKIELDKSKLMVSGPINVARMVGTVNGVTKVVYLFFDIHALYPDQRECSNVFSEEIIPYIVDNLSAAQTENNNITYDFFHEITPSDVTSKGIRKYDTKIERVAPYIYYLTSLFQRFIQMDPDNRVKQSTSLKNVRFHYADPRDYFEGPDFLVWHHVADMVLQLYNQRDGNSELLNKIYDVVWNIYDFNRNTSSILQKVITQRKEKKIKFRAIKEYDDFRDMKKNGPEIYLGIEYFSNKIVHRYRNDNIREKLMKYVLYTYSLVEQYLTKVKNFIKLLDSAPFFQYTPPVNDNVLSDNVYDDQKRLFDKLNNKTTELSGDSIHSKAVVLDIYFLRRLLDKEYITNALIYSGANHSIRIMHILRKDFDFEVTHIARSNVESLEKLNELLLRDLDLDDLTQILFPKSLIQCSDLTSFPKNFL